MAQLGVIAWLALLLLLSGNSHAQTQLTRDWACALSSVGATLTQCQAAPTVAGERYAVTIIIAQTTTQTAGQWAVQTGTGTNCGTGTKPLFPVNSLSGKFNGQTGGVGVINFHPIYVLAPADAAICVIGTTPDTTNIQLMGFITR